MNMAAKIDACAKSSSLIRHSEYKTTTVQQDEVVDFIVVGSGTAGSAVASRLSEYPGWNTLVLEAGGQPPPQSKIPAMNLHFYYSNDKYVYNFMMEPQKHALKSFNYQGHRFPRGQMIGGSSAMNTMIYIRGNRLDFDRWAAMGNPGWDYDSVLPIFKKLETYKGQFSEKFAEYHGTEGPVAVETFRWQHPITKYFKAAGKELGLRETDLNSNEPIGYSVPDMSIKDGERYSASDAYLKSNLDRPNLRIQIRTQVIKVIINENRRAVGVKYLHEGKIKRVYARKEVILSAGAIDSPKLLMLSGIGPKNHLQSLGIKTIVDLKGVGQNLQDHLKVIGLTWLKENNAGNGMTEMDEGKALPAFLNNLKEYRANRTGPLSVPAGLVGHYLVNLGVNPDPKIPDVQIAFASATMGVDGGGSVASNLGIKREVARDYFRGQLFRTGFSSEIYQTRPKSRGYLTLRSSNPSEPPVIDPNYLYHPDDVDVLVKDDYWRCFARGLTATACHYCCTCKMAPDSDPDGVVSPRLKVRGISALRVIDSSIMPYITSNNLNAPTLMVGEKGAAMIKEDWGIVDA
ncbi:Glucose-methanol-choline oxidoreductase C-terminal [Trinorchestia longiramus]|nr:Glucose-methanol-choline oxidoreductase C-terminal [Trinorchestia longiramus]